MSVFFWVSGYLNLGSFLGVLFIRCRAVLYIGNQKTDPCLENYPSEAHKLFGEEPPSYRTRIRGLAWAFPKPETLINPKNPKNPIIPIIKPVNPMVNPLTPQPEAALHFQESFGPWGLPSPINPPKPLSPRP